MRAFLLGLAVFAAPAMADTYSADGMPAGTLALSQRATKAWDECLDKKLINPAEFTTDPSDVVADIVMYICETEFSNAKFAWQRMLVAESRFKPTDEQAEKMAEEAFGKFAVMRKNRIMMNVSYIRQDVAMKRAGQAIRDRLKTSVK